VNKPSPLNRAISSCTFSLDWAIACSGSFYQWETPVLGLNEIYRVLKRGGIALLYETYRDFDEAELKNAIDNRLKDSGWIRRQIGKRLILKQHEMTYIRAEFTEILGEEPVCRCVRDRTIGNRGAAGLASSEAPEVIPNDSSRI